MKNLFLMSFILSLSPMIFAGPISSGGGDAKVAEFLNIADEVCHWSLRQNPNPEDASMKVCATAIQNLKGSLDQSNVPKVAFTNSDLYDQGVIKAALFDRDKGRIVVNRILWDQSSVLEKYVIVGIEIAGLCGVEKRYEFGQKIATSFENFFEANSMTCEINAKDPKTNTIIQLLPPTTKAISRDYDFEFQTTLKDSNDKKWNVWLLESAPAPGESEIELSWSVRDTLMKYSALESVFASWPLVNGAKVSTGVVFGDVVITAHCELQSKKQKSLVDERQPNEHDKDTSTTSSGDDSLKINTIVGTVEIKIKNEKNCEGTLDSKKIFNFNCEFQYLPNSLGVFKSKGKDYDQVIALQESPMGNACNGGPLHFFGLSKAKGLKNIGIIDFCGGNDPVLSSTRNQINIIFPGGMPNHGAQRVHGQRWKIVDGKIIKEGF